MNLCVHVGNLTRDPETRLMQSNGKKRTTFGIAVSRKHKNADGGYDADYINFVAYDKTAELCEKYLAKGRKILVQSHVKTGSYEKDGKRIYTTEFVVDSIEFLSSKDSTGSAQASSTVSGGTSSAGTGSVGEGIYGGFTPVNDDDLPF